jgi:hypothetical protein
MDEEGKQFHQENDLTKSVAAAAELGVSTPEFLPLLSFIAV